MPRRHNNTSYYWFLHALSSVSYLLKWNSPNLMETQMKGVRRQWNQLCFNDSTRPEKHFFRRLSEKRSFLQKCYPSNLMETLMWEQLSRSYPHKPIEKVIHHVRSFGDHLPFLFWGHFEYNFRAIKLVGISGIDIHMK